MTIKVLSGIVVLLAGIGSLGLLLGYIWMLVAAFRISVGWGLGVLLLGGIFGPLFLVFHWDEAKGALLLIVLSAVALIAAAQVSDRVDRLERLRQEREAILNE